MEQQRMISVLLVEDHPLMRRLIRHLLTAAEDILVVGEAESGIQALTLVESLRPDVVILDISMPGMDGLEVADRLHDVHELSTRVLIYSVDGRRGLVAEALRRGAAGFLLKDSAVNELVDAVVAVGSGRTFLSAAVAG